MSASCAAVTFTGQTLNLKINCSIELQIQEECFWKHMFLSFLFLMILSHILRELSFPDFTLYSSFLIELRAIGL